MPRERYSNQEKAQCVLWKKQGYRYTRIQRIFRVRYNKNPLSRSSIDRWYDDYRARGTHQHRGGNGHPQLSSRVKSEIRKKFNSNPALFLRQLTSQFNVHHTKVRNFMKKSSRCSRVNCKVPRQ